MISRLLTTFGGVQELKTLCNLHYVLNIALSLTFIIIKNIQPICALLLTDDAQCQGFDRREHETLVFLGVIIFWKNRKATNWLHYLSNVFLFSKLANGYLMMRADPLIGVIYLVLCIVITVLFPQPAYTGPEKVTYFQGAELQDQLNKHKHTTWIIQFYTTWSPECRHVVPVFAKLSDRFTLPNLRFGKLDIGRWPKEAEHFCINAHATSRQLPTISVFRDGVEVRRRPIIGTRQRAVPFVFTEENCIFEFDLNNLHSECKQNLNRNERQQLQGDEEDKKTK